MKVSKLSRAAVIAIALSLIFHGLFFGTSPFIKLQGMRQVMDQTRRMFRLEDVVDKTTTVSFFEDSDIQAGSVKMSQPVTELKKKQLREMTLDGKNREDLALAAKKKELRKEQAELKETEKFDIDDMLKAEEKKANKDAAPDKKSLAEKLLNEDLVRQTVTADVADRDLNYTEERIDLDRSREEAGIFKPSRKGAFRPGENENTIVSGRTRVGDYDDIGQFLEVFLETYIDPETNEKYFRLTISVVPESPLAAIPKEVIFLIDSSKSITEEKLSFIKEGVEDAIENLNSGDSFNVVAFRGDIVKFRERPVLAREKVLNEARSFIRGLEAVGQTDVGNALLEMTEEPLDFDPSYIVLVTDGRPTTGVTDSRRIIQEITRSNNRRRPIFCFGGGKKVNRYLLDFISYQNRAWSKFADITNNIRRDFGRFFKQIKDPLLLNVRYNLNGVDAGTVYPKYLSDFYIGKPFVLYGRFTGEDVFSMQLLGEMGGVTKEFIFKKSLKNAEKGDESIAAEWAFRKTYHLISQNTMGVGDPAKLKAEINELSRKYNITTPYDIEDRNVN